MVEGAPNTQANTVVSFPGMDPGEKFQFYFRRHWSRQVRYFGFLFLWMCAFILLMIVSGVEDLSDDSTRRALIIMLCVFFLIPHFMFTMKFYKHFLTVTIVTDRKVHQFKRTLIAVDTHQSVDLWMLQDIDKLQRSVVQNLLGFGSLRLEAQNSQLVIHFVPHIQTVYEKIVALREAVRSRNHVAPSPNKAIRGPIEGEGLPGNAPF